MADAFCAAIVLSAGASTRLRQPKQLIRIRGESLLRRTVRFAAKGGCWPVFVVLGYEAETIARELDELNTRTVLNLNWQSGMGSSLSAGMKYMLSGPEIVSNVMVLVCDQLYLSSELISRLITTHRATQPRITAAQYAGRLGVPAIFSSQLFPELLQSSGDQGARRLIDRHLSHATWVDFPEGADDLDTPADLLSL